MSAVQVTIDPSQFPDQVRAGLHRCLRSRQIDPKFHYESHKQARAWLALHEAFSPARRDPACQRIYQEAMSHVASRSGAVHLIGLGCGGGQKETVLLRLLDQQKQPAVYTPVDVSVPLTLVAAQCAELLVKSCWPTACDLAAATDLEGLVGSRTPRNTQRVITLFGMLPNVEAGLILPKVATLLRPGDTLLISANLAAPENYPASLKAILPQYENKLTNEWLMIFLNDLGVQNGLLQWSIEPAAASADLYGFVAWFELREITRVLVDDQEHLFKARERIRLFASWRYTPALLNAELSKVGLRVAQQWITPSGEEGVFLVNH